MMKVLGFFLKSIHFIVEFLVLYLVMVLILPFITISNEDNHQVKEVEIFILTNGVHTDIVVPAKHQLKDWRKDIDYLGKNNSYKYLAMGWGDKGFYLDTPTWAELKTSVAIKAALGINTTAIHTTFYRKMEVNDKCKNMWLSLNQYQRLIDYITHSFKLNNQQKFIKVNTAVKYGLTDAFYEAKGRYHLFKTCNTWANNALYACGQKCCFWTALDWGIFKKY